MPKVIKVICLIFIANIVTTVDMKDTEDYSDVKQEQVVVRAVFINCEPNEEQNYLENEATRFQREELFKHNALQRCHRKLALTVKMTSEPNKNSGDEYIPIEHVFDGSNKKRARLLDPYILRIRRDPPVQAYKLRRIDTVSGILTRSSDRSLGKLKKNRVQRNLDIIKEQEERMSLNAAIRQSTADSSVEGKQDPTQCLKSENIVNLTKEISSSTSNTSAMLNMQPVGKDLNEYKTSHIDQNIHGHTRVKRDRCTLANNPAWKRDKRHEHNIIVEDITDDYKIPWVPKDRFYRKLEQSSNIVGDLNEKSKAPKTDNDNFLQASQKTKPHIHRSSHSPNEHQQASLKREKLEDKSVRNDNVMTSTTKLKGKSYNGVDHSTHRSINDKKVKSSNKQSPVDSPEKSFVLYDIGNPDLWYAVHVQLFEKMSTSEGKTVWNDITKGEVASVSSVQPEWADQDMNVRYKPTEWISKDEFILPAASSDLCLLVPLFDGGPADANDDVVTDLNIVGKFIVIHKDDIVDVAAKNSLSKRDENYSDFSSIHESNNLKEQTRRRVLVRVSRALLTGNEDDMRVSSLGSEHFLTLPHRRPHHAQIDLEARADENQLIRVGSSGSIITVVADNSRRTRSVITIQATNKGLAAARFKVLARDCGPEMASILNEKEDKLIAGPTLLPPRHTQHFRLELPVEIPVNIVHCSVALINDDEESVAVRDVSIRKGDRCFCVWHCDCVCLNEDPKLLCREMSETRQVAAGLSPRERTRRARSVCYKDVVSLNCFVVMIGVLMALFVLGLIKACFGLFCRCAAKWGLERLIQMPRKLDQYYESELRNRCVVYDKEGWPVHPDTHKRSVRVMGRPIEFILNLIFFITVPCIMFCDALRQLLRRSTQPKCGVIPVGRDKKKCFSSHDMQGRRQPWCRRRAGLRRWMTPQAQDLSTDIWSEGLATRKSIECEFMRPLLHERHIAEASSSCMDSEQDDTEYVLMQMHKSKESLAKSQRKLNESTPSATARKPLNTEAKLSHNVLRQN